jgi:hypothetical protein
MVPVGPALVPILLHHLVLINPITHTRMKLRSHSIDKLNHYDRRTACYWWHPLLFYMRTWSIAAAQRRPAAIACAIHVACTRQQAVASQPNGTNAATKPY